MSTVDLGTTINCDGFADKHTDAAHFDRSSFVGMAWRPPGAPVCIEAYSTGKMNIPGARSLQTCINTFAGLLPQLVEFTALQVPAHMRDLATAAGHDDLCLENDDACAASAEVNGLDAVRLAEAGDVYGDVESGSNGCAQSDAEGSSQSDTGLSDCD